MNNKKKFLFVNGTQFGYSSGHYYYCKYLSDSFNISYICYDRGLDKMVLKGVEVLYVSFSGNQVFRIFRFIKECITRIYIKQPDLLFVTYFNLSFLLPLFCKSGRKVLDIRTGSLKENFILRGLDNLLILIQSLFYEKVVILSESLRNKLHISGRKSMALPLGSEIYFSGNHKFDNINLLYVGSLDDRKVYETVRGLYLFLKRNANIKAFYTIIGFGTEKETSKINSYISDYDLPDYVKFVGRKNNEELIPYFEISNVGIAFVPLTPWFNCQPLTKLFEYLLSGMPVIAADNFENRQIINADNGVLIQDTAEDFCIGLEHIYNQRLTYDSLVIRKSVEQYTWGNIVNNILKPYLLELIKKK